MANNNSKKKTNTNNKKNNTKKVDTTKKINEVKNNKKELEKKEIKKVTPKEEVKVEKTAEVVKEKVEKERKTFKLSSKQRDLILILLAVVLLVMALVLTGNKEPKFDIELPVVLEGTVGFNEITYAEYEEKLGTEAPFVVVIKRDGCSFCEMYDPVVKEVAEEYALPISYINLSNLSNDEYTALSSSNSYLKKEQWGTPTTLFMYGENVVASIGGYIDKEEFVEFVKENFVVEE